MKYLIGFFVLCALILFHEFGHFIAARMAGVFVEEFAVGMGPKVWSHVSNKSGTRYSLRAIPVGGFCLMKGEQMVDGQIRADSDSFSKASVWKRIGIVAAGPLVNLGLGLILCVILVAVFGHDAPLVQNISSVAQTAGLSAGDEVLSVNGTPIGSSHELYFHQWYTGHSCPDTMYVTVRRNDEIYDISYQPEPVEKYGFGIVTGTNDHGELLILQFLEENAFEGHGAEVGDTIVQIRDVRGTVEQSLADYLQEEPLTQNPVSIVYRHQDKEIELEIQPVMVDQTEFGFGYQTKRLPSDNLLQDTWATFRYQIVSVEKSLRGLLTGRFGLRDMSGPVMMMNSIGTQSSAIVNAETDDARYEAGAEFLLLIIMLTVNLGLLNLLPIPGLDGGTLVFFFLEVIRKKPISTQIQNKIQTAGLMCLVLLMAGILLQDLYHLLF